MSRRAQIQDGQPGMSEADIKAIIARQMPDVEKRKRADIVVRTGLSRHLTNQKVRRLVLELLK